MAKDMLDGIEAVLFDLDGTLVDSLWVWHEIDIEYLGRFGLTLPAGLQEDIGGMSFTETALYVKERFQIPDCVEKIKEDWNQMAWEKYTHQVPLKKGVSDFLALCRERGIRLGIATSNSRELVENILKTHGLEGYFDCIVTGCEVNKGKPSPDVYLEAARRCGVSPHDCLVCEDIVPGILAGKSAVMRVCAEEDTYSVEQREEKQRLSDYYISDYCDWRLT